MKYSLSFRLKSYARFAFDKLVGFRNIKFLIRNITARRIYKQAGGPAYRCDEADTVIWTYYPDRESYRYNHMWDMLLMAYAAENKQKFMVHDGPDIGIYKNKKILFTVHKDKLNFFGVENYASYYHLITQELENQNNKVYPTYHDMLYWENKKYMYEMFTKLGIHHPRTVIYDNFEKLIQDETSFPFLIKIPHSSGSYGLFNVIDKEYLLSLRTDPIILSTKYYIAQERLNITEDMRIIFAGDKIIHSYWRKNRDKSKWKTTSTSNGSSVDFEYFPEQWREYFIDVIKKTGLIMGAFDLGWQNDDVTTEPYFFEVSPSYDINPTITDEHYLEDYGAWKKKLLFKGSFDRLFVEWTHKLKGQGAAIFFQQCEEEEKRKRLS